MKVGRKAQRTLLYEEVVNELYRIIDENKIQPGAKFPSERELVEDLEISRNVLREAFHVLESRGIIVSRQGKGRYLRTLPPVEEKNDKYAKLSKNLERYSLLEMYEVRQALEVKAVELVIRNASDADIEEIESLYRKMEEKFNTTNITEGEFALHKSYAKKSGNLFLEQMIDVVLTSILDMMNNTFHEVMIIHTTVQEMKQHREIILAIKQRNANMAKEHMFKHLQHTIDLIK